MTRKRTRKLKMIRKKNRISRLQILQLTPRALTETAAALRIRNNDGSIKIYNDYLYRLAGLLFFFGVLC